MMGRRCRFDGEVNGAGRPLGAGCRTLEGPISCHDSESVSSSAAES